MTAFAMAVAASLTAATIAWVVRATWSGLFRGRRLDPLPESPQRRAPQFDSHRVVATPPTRKASHANSGKPEYRVSWERPRQSFAKRLIKKFGRVS